mgnify:CR=1 FL=1
MRIYIDICVEYSRDMREEITIIYTKIADSNQIYRKRIFQNFQFRKKP